MSAINNDIGMEQIGNHSDSDSKEMSAQELRVKNLTENATEDTIQKYSVYRLAIDTARAANAERRFTDNMDLQKELSELSSDCYDRKEEVKKICKDLPGNLPAFRQAFPAEESEGLGTEFYILSEDEEKRLGIGRPEGDDPIVLPITEGGKWTAVAATGYVEIEAAIDPSDFTLPELKVEIEDLSVEDLEGVLEAEKAGKDRKGGVGMIEDQIEAIEDEWFGSEDSEVKEAVEETEKTEKVAETVDPVKEAIAEKIRAGETLTEQEMQIVAGN